MIALQLRQPHEVLVGLHGDRFAPDVEERSVEEVSSSADTTPSGISARSSTT